MIFKRVIVSIFIVTATLAQSQNLLSIDEALKIGLENNYNIRVAKNDVAIAASQNNAGNAGLTPTVTATGARTFASINSYQEFATGVIQERNGARSNNINAALNLNWTLFDGFRMFALQKRLDVAQELASLDYQQVLQNTVYEISTAYYDLVRIQRLIKANQQNLEIYDEREKVSKVKYEIGLDTKVDLALIQLDKNRIVADIKRLEQQYLLAKIALNKVLARSVEADFSVSDSIDIVYAPTYDQLKKDVTGGNLSLLSSRKRESLLYQDIREANSFLYPLIQFTSSYNLIRARNQAGLLLRNNQQGLNLGIIASWTLFDGLRNSRYVQETKLRYASQQYLSRQAQLEVDAVVYAQFKSYTLQKEIMQLEKQNLAYAQSIVDISSERYKVGKATLLETKEVQRNLEDTQIRYINSLYDAKKAELELLRANNQLVQ